MTASKLIASSLVLGAAVYGSSLLIEKETKLETLEAKAVQSRTKDGKYRFEKGADYEIHEYVAPTGEAGYQIIYTDETGIHSKGYGPEAKDRTYSIPTVASTTL